MRTPQFILPLAQELIVDLFAGGGGASTGIELATGRHVDIAINHDSEAVALHQANHPQTRHFVSDVFEVDPIAVTDGRPVGLLWASPDCKHFSKAKGSKPVSKRVRSLAWVVVKWAKAVRPRMICLENVEEFQTWGPLGDDNRPCPERKGRTFRRWVSSLEGLGYTVKWRELRACDYGAPTIRKRLFLIARLDGLPIVWPEPTHGDPSKIDTKSRGLRPWRTAAECIDWSIPCPSIFDRQKPLAEATLRRIARGIVRYVLQAREPFIVSLAHGEESPGGVKRWGPGVRSLHQPVQTVLASGNGAAICTPFIAPLTHTGSVRVETVDEPLRTTTCAHRGERALVVPTLIQTGYGERPGQAPRVPGLHKPLGTAVNGQKHALVSAFLAKHYTGVVGADLRQPAPTVTTVDHNSVVAAYVSKLRDENIGHAAGAPLHTISAGGTHHAAVAALLVKYYGTEQDPKLGDPLHTITTRDRFGVVTVQLAGETYAISDIGMRMLQPRELYLAQGFGPEYTIDRGADGRPLSKTAQVRMCGNSVCPPVAAALVRSNYVDLALEAAAA